MSHKKYTVSVLAKEAKRDIEETLVLLWDAGLTTLKDENSIVHRRESNRARRALGVPTRREFTSIDYWQKEMSLSSEEFVLLLIELKIDLGGRRTINKKEISRLKAAAQSRENPTAGAPTSNPLILGGKKQDKLVWQNVGHVRPLKHLNAQQIKEIHGVLVEDLQKGPDPIEPHGVRSDDLLESAAHRPFTSIGATTKYPTIEMAAAALLHSLVHDHAFHNGNKRTALVSMLVFLDENGLVLTCHEDSLFKLVLQLAQHSIVRDTTEDLADREVLAVARWLKENSRWIQMGDRALPWRRLQRILTDLKCTFDIPSSAGSKMNIYREVSRKGSFLSKSYVATLSTQTCYQGNGREVDKNAINKIRHDLELTEEYGIDSGRFYDNAPATASEFIVKYSKIIRRLSRL